MTDKVPVENNKLEEEVVPNWKKGLQAAWEAKRRKREAEIGKKEIDVTRDSKPKESLQEKPSKLESPKEEVTKEPKKKKETQRKKKKEEEDWKRSSVFDESLHLDDIPQDAYDEEMLEDYLQPQATSYESSWTQMPMVTSKKRKRVSFAPEPDRPVKKKTEKKKQSHESEQLSDENEDEEEPPRKKKKGFVSKMGDAFVDRICGIVPEACMLGGAYLFLFLYSKYSNSTVIDTPPRTVVHNTKSNEFVKSVPNQPSLPQPQVTSTNYVQMIDL